ncbi:MAG TPA: hypothetical protein VFY40_27995 [Blastocatellia bacterium]|nr:hypothetical protein [Blastocatellia bacterium]
MKQLTFAEEHSYKDDGDGIPLQVRLIYAGQSIEVTAKVDPGSTVCLFSHEVGLALGIPVEQGIPKRLGSLTGSLDAFGHEVTLQTGDIAFQSFVYFAKYPNLPRNLLGRQGWLRNLRLGLVDYDNLLYLSAYGA